MAAISENFASLLEPGLRKIFTEQYNQMPEMRPMLFNSQPSDTSYEKDSSEGAFGNMAPFTGTIDYDDITEGYPVTYTAAKFPRVLRSSAGCLTMTFMVSLPRSLRG